MLGSLNVVNFVKEPFTKKAKFDWDEFKKVVRIFTRMLDNVVDDNGLPLEQQQYEITYKRRHGMGYLGLGSAMTMLGMEYGSSESIEFTEELTKVMAVEGFKVGVELAKEKGKAPIFEDGDNIKQWVDSPYMKRIWSAWPEGKELASQDGCRFTHHTSIAPTGTISLSINNNVSNGIEPTFSHKYLRNVIQQGKKTKKQVPVYSYEMLLYKHIYGVDEVPETFSTADSVTTKQHVDIQAAAQYWVDSSISKTINVPTNMKFDDFKDVYMYAYEKGLKGCTTFRFNPEAFSGVLVNVDDVKSTMYSFTLKDGSVVEVSGDTTIEYEGETHTASNLYDAIKEGYFGKF